MGVYPRGVDGDRLRRDRNDVTEVARSGPDWVSFAIEVTDTVQKAIPFDRCHWHTVGPGTVLFTGSANRDVSCSGTWLAEHEYAIEDVNKWWFPARGGHRAGATSLATHGDTYWGAATFLRDSDRSWSTEDDVPCLSSRRPSTGSPSWSRSHHPGRRRSRGWTRRIHTTGAVNTNCAAPCRWVGP
jgi:hypothetical protein